MTISKLCVPCLVSCTARLCWLSCNLVNHGSRWQEHQIYRAMFDCKILSPLCSGTINPVYSGIVRFALVDVLIKFRFKFLLLLRAPRAKPSLSNGMLVKCNELFASQVILGPKTKLWSKLFLFQSKTQIMAVAKGNYQNACCVGVAGKMIHQIFKQTWVMSQWTTARWLNVLWVLVPGEVPGPCLWVWFANGKHWISTTTHHVP